MCLFIGCLEHVWGASLVMRVFAYALPTFRLRGEAPLFSDFGHAHFEAWDSAEKETE